MVALAALEVALAVAEVALAVAEDAATELDDIEEIKSNGMTIRAVFNGRPVLVLAEKAVRSHTRKSTITGNISAVYLVVTGTEGPRIIPVNI